MSHVLPASIGKYHDDLADVKYSAQVCGDDSAHFIAVVQWLLHGANTYVGGCGSGCGVVVVVV